MSWNKYDSGENGAEETPDSEERSEVFGLQVHSETEVSGGYQEVTVCVPAEMPPVVPVTGESFCQCPAQTELNSHINPNICTCGEEEQGCDWVWDMESKSPGTTLSCSDRMVSFHSDYSCGTAAVRGSQAINDGQHFWEIKMTSPVYGTDMMVGVGTPEVNMDQFRHSFCSMLGTDEDSWGLSYTGQLHHKGSKLNFSSRFGQGSIIGLHLDTWHGTLSFYKNRRCIGVAATHLQNKRLYPMVCSTAAKSSMKLIRSRSTPTTLQYLCCTQLRCMLPDCADARRMMSLPPGLRMLLSNRLGWVLSLGCWDGNDKVDCVEQDTSPVPIHIPTGPDHDFISSSVSDNPGSYNSKEIYHDSTSLDEGSYPDSASLMDVSCHFCPSSPSDPSFMSDHTPLSDPTHHPVPPVCPSTSLPAHTMFLPDSNSDSDSDEFCSDSETYQRKRCRWT